MTSRNKYFAALTAFVLSGATFVPTAAHATIVRVESVLGDFDINLYDNATPATVQNFLSYVQDGSYTDSFFHRTVPDFIAQSGGFRTDINTQISDVPSMPAVINEPVFSNVRGTIAMAKLAGNPNSATNQWFINLANNAGNLDNQNGGFTVFGEVTGNGMTVVDAIAALPRFAFAEPLAELPLRDYTATDFTNNVPVDNTHLVIVTGISVIDNTVDTAAGLNPTPTTANPAGNPTSGGGGGGGGTFGVVTLLALVVATRRRFRMRNITR